MEIDRGSDVHFCLARQRDIGGTNYEGTEAMSEVSNSASIINPALQEQHFQFQQQLFQLKQQQHLQQQLLLQHYQQQQQQLAEHHEKQMQERIKMYLEQQKRMEEQQKMEKERRDKERLEQLKKKDKHEQSAVASSEVKQRLQEFVLNKKQREAAVNSTSSPPSLKNWPPLIGKYEDDFPPLRKTASEPNLKVRSILKQKVHDRRSSPLLRRKDNKGPTPKRRPLTNGSNCSSPGSPPNGANMHSMHSSTPIQKEPGTSPFHSLTAQGSVCDLTLYSSPSMPNISLGRPPVHNSVENKNLVAASEAQVRAMAAVRLGMPLTSHMLHSSLPFYPALPVIDGEFTPPTSPVYIQHHRIKVLEEGRSSSGSVGVSVVPPIYPPGTVITDAQVAQARLHRNIQRPLGRTQSAPLPLGHPMLQPQNLILSAQQNDQLLREKQLYEQQQQHNLLKQHIRNAVLTRAGSKTQVENVEEENEAAMAQEMKDSSSEEQSSQAEVIDLTDGRKRDNNGDSDMLSRHELQDTFLQQQDLMEQHKLHISEGSAFTPRAHAARPLSRALSSPLVALSPVGSPPESCITRHTFTTGLVYDNLMLKHQCICGVNAHHLEHGGRLQSIWARLSETSLISRCERVRSRKATLEEIQSCHSESYTLLFGTNPLHRQKMDVSKLVDLPIKHFVMLPCGGIGVDSDTTWNELHTASAARMAAGCVVELALKVGMGEIKNGFAIVRPPGHHAEPQQAMGFCFFNSVAIAAKQLRQKLKMEKILIVDWDVHHGNGIQQIFYDDPHVLYISLHRHDDGNFFPGTGDLQEVGTEDGIGFNINIAWSSDPAIIIGDAEYLTAFRTIVMPIAMDFDPDVVLVASGFDAAYGHPSPLGGYQLSPACFGHMTKQLMQLAKGKVVLALEGGYDLTAICDCTQECVACLLGDDASPLKEEELSRKPCQAAVEVLQRIVTIQVPHWPCIKRLAHTINYSLMEAQKQENEEVETVTALASLSMALPHGHIHSPKSEEETEEPMDEDQGK